MNHLSSCIDIQRKRSHLFTLKLADGIVVSYWTTGVACLWSPTYSPFSDHNPHQVPGHINGQVLVEALRRLLVVFMMNELLGYHIQSINKLPSSKRMSYLIN